MSGRTPRFEWALTASVARAVDALPAFEPLPAFDPLPRIIAVTAAEREALHTIEMERTDDGTYAPVPMYIPTGLRVAVVHSRADLEREIAAERPHPIAVSDGASRLK